MESGGGSGGPAPFLVKTYDMVDDSNTDETVSWSSTNNSFVVWNPPEFSRLLLPTYFKHNNFSSFIRQLNTYGFRKIDPERWEFANEDFIKDKKHLLKNIHRRKPIHSHSNPPGSEDSERAALDEEIEKLSRDKTAIQTNLWRIKQQKSKAKVQLEELEQKVLEMEQSQWRIRSFLERALKNPTFVEHLIRMGSSSMQFSAINKKRRLPNADYSQDLAASSYVDDNDNTPRSLSSHFQQDFSNKLRLELSPAVSDTNFLSPTAQSSNEFRLSPQTGTSDEDQSDVNMGTQAVVLAPETLELSDTCTSFLLGNSSSLPRQAREIDCPSIEDCDSHITCQLSLALACSTLQADDNQFSADIPKSNHDSVTNSEVRPGAIGRDRADIENNRNFTNHNVAMASSRDVLASNQGQATAQARVNDQFWEQFLTERPGASENEEASSSFRGNKVDDQESNEKSWRSRDAVEQLTL